MAEIKTINFLVGHFKVDQTKIRSASILRDIAFISVRASIKRRLKIEVLISFIKKVIITNNNNNLKKNFFCLVQIYITNKTFVLLREK